MRHIFFAAVVVVSIALGAAGPAAAQSAGTPTASTPIGPQPTANDTERIDNQTTIIDSELVTENNQSAVRVTLRSDIVQPITLYDPAAVREGGEVPVRTEVLTSGETATLEIPVNSSGFVGVAISTENTPLYSEVIKQPGGGSGSGGGLDVMRVLGSLQAWAAGVAGAFLWMILAGYSVLSREDGSPEVAT